MTVDARQTGWGDPRSRTVRWHDPAPTALEGLSRPGLAYLQAMLDGELPPSPIAALVGLEPVSVTDGEVRFRCRPDESFYNPVGTVHGGLLCTLLDSAAACAVHSTLPAGVGFTSVELKTSFLRSVQAGDELEVRGWVVKRGRRICFAEAEVRDGAGRSVATGSSSVLVVDLSGS